MAEISLTERYIYLGSGVLYMLAFCFLSWRIFSHKGYISAVLMFFFFIVLSIFNFRLSILNVLLVGILGYGMYAGILGTFAYRRYQKTTDIAIFD